MRTAAAVLTAPVLMTLVAVLATGSSVAADELRVMSFNIRYGTANDGKDVWPMRQQLVQSTISAFQPDLLGTQETLPFQADYLKSQMPDYEYFGWSRDASENGEQCGLFLRKSRFEVVQSGQFWLSETPDVKFSKSWDSSLPRVSTWVKLKDLKFAGREFIFANTHFDHRGVEARKNAAKVIRRELATIAANLPVVLTGDFNCDEGSEPWKELLSDNALKDCLREIQPAKGDQEGTFHGFSGKPGEARIDWILTSSHFRTRTAAIDRTNENGRYPSDHFPVTATLEWSK